MTVYIWGCRYSITSVECEGSKVTSKTRWALEAVPRGRSVRRLSPLSLAASFHRALLSQDTSSRGKYSEETTSKISCACTRQPPHPCVPDMKSALLIPSDSPAAQRILHVEGIDDNHVGECIQSAAGSFGMRYVEIRGTRCSCTRVWYSRLDWPISWLVA